MVIMGVDPAINYGACIWNTETNKITTMSGKISFKNRYNIKRYIKALEDLLESHSEINKKDIDFTCIERPFFRSAKAFETQWGMFSMWRAAILIVLGIHLKCELDKITKSTKGRIVWPKTWESRVIPGSKDTKKDAKIAALAKFPTLSQDLTHDEYDSVCIMLYQYYMCRDLGESDPKKKRVLEAMQAGGWLVPTKGELGLD